MGGLDTASRLVLTKRRESPLSRALVFRIAAVGFVATMDVEAPVAPAIGAAFAMPMASA
jgi:hypothetical protein